MGTNFREFRDFCKTYRPKSNTLTAKMFENIFGEQMFGGFFIKSPKIISVKMDFETFQRNRHLVDRNICSHTISMF